MAPSQRIRDPLGDFVNQYTGFATITSAIALQQGRPQATCRTRSRRPRSPTRRCRRAAGSANVIPRNPVQPPRGFSLGRYTNLGNHIGTAGNVYRRFGRAHPEAAESTTASPSRTSGASGAAWCSTSTTSSTAATTSRSRSRHQHGGPDLLLHGRALRPEPVGAQPVPQHPDAGQVPRLAAQHAEHHGRRRCCGPSRSTGPSTRRTSPAGRSACTRSRFRCSAPSPRASASSSPTPTTARRRPSSSTTSPTSTASSSGSTRRSPRHRLTNAVTWDIPVGRGRWLLTDAPRAVDCILGGWTVHDDDPHLLGPAAHLRPEQSARSRRRPGERQPGERDSHAANGSTAPPSACGITRTTRTSRRRYLAAPTRGTSTDSTGRARGRPTSTMSKGFQLTERFKLEARVEAYNAFNHLN